MSWTAPDYLEKATTSEKANPFWQPPEAISPEVQGYLARIGAPPDAKIIVHLGINDGNPSDWRK